MRGEWVSLDWRVGNGKDEDEDVIDSIMGLLMGAVMEVWGSILGLAWFYEGKDDVEVVVSVLGMGLVTVTWLSR
jgi:uncharacterized membrane protein (Fun14 family)